MTALRVDPALTPPSGATSSHGSHCDLKADHALLLAQVATRVRAVRDAGENGQWPAAELHELVRYFRCEVLRHATDEEWTCFASTSPALRRLSHDHARLRIAVDFVDRTATDEPHRSPAVATLIARDLLRQFERHVRTEERALATHEITMTTTSPSARYPHEWYELTHQPVIDLDALPKEHAVDAVTARLLRLEPGERIRIRSSSEPTPVWRRMNHLSPGGYGFTYLRAGPAEWALEVTRRS